MSLHGVTTQKNCCPPKIPFVMRVVWIYIPVCESYYLQPVRRIVVASSFERLPTKETAVNIDHHCIIV